MRLTAYHNLYNIWLFKFKQAKQTTTRTNRIIDKEIYIYSRLTLIKI